MKKMISPLALVVALVATTAAAQESIVTPYDGSFDDATFAVESAIVEQGLVIDYVSHVGEMLSRTGADVGSDVVLFDAAQIFVFCSAKVSRAVMEADPSNIAHCPYGIYVADAGGEVTVGYRSYPEGPMQQVQQLLATIVQSATE